MTKAVYPGTFDPITKGHVDVVRRAAKIFDPLTAAVGVNPAKRSLFSQEERLDMVRFELRGVPNVRVDSFEGLLVDYLKAQGISVVVRGIRSRSDFDYEYPMALTNRAMLPDMETAFIIASPEYSFLSSQLLREVAAADGDITAFVSPYVAERLKKKLAAHAPGRED
jgi:pantetheine-phosphate adenylyltransferase